MRKVCCLVWLLILTSLVWGQNKNEVFPLTKGTTWQYTGTIRWTTDENTVKEAPISWEMKVAGKIVRSGIEIAYIQGHPQDLCWYGEGTKPGNYLIARFKTKYYLLTLEDSDWRKAAAKIKKKDNGLVLAGESLDLFLELPLYEGKTLAERIPDHPEHEYCWYVASALPANWEAQAGTIYRLVFQTRPDTTTFEFLPGVGIISFKYEHHGTVAEVKLQLTKMTIPVSTRG